MPHEGAPTPPEAGRERRRDARDHVGRADWRQRRTSWTMRLLQLAILAFLLVAGLGPILWMLKSSVTPTQDTLRAPMALWPTVSTCPSSATAWTRTHIDRYLFNTVVIAFGSWAAQIIVATTAGFALSVLKPRGSRLIMGLVIATLFVPPIVLLVPLYLTIVDVPVVHWRMIDSYWAIWLPAGASAINIILMKRFFDNLRARSSMRPRSTAPGRSGCSGRSCCRCHGRSLASCPSSP